MDKQNASSKLRQYQRLRRHWEGSTLIPKEKRGIADFRAAYHAMDMTEAHLFYYALNGSGEEKGSMNAYLERVSGQREMQRVNARSRVLWKPEKFRLKYFLMGVFRDVTAKP